MNYLTFYQNFKINSQCTSFLTSRYLYLTLAYRLLSYKFLLFNLRKLTLLRKNPHLFNYVSFTYSFCYEHKNLRPFTTALPYTLVRNSAKPYVKPFKLPHLIYNLLNIFKLSLLNRIDLFNTCFFVITPLYSKTGLFCLNKWLT